MIGTTLSHYRIVEKIGEGGMGEVNRAHDERLDRNVAIKVPSEAVSQNPDRLARFEREAKALDLIDELLSIPCELSVGLLRLDPVYDPLRGHPRYQEILEKYGSRDAAVH